MQVVVDGISNGLPLALLSVAFAMVYLPTRVFHLSLAAAYTLAPYLAWTLKQNGCSWAVAAPVAILGGALLSLLTELLNHRWLSQRDASSAAHFVSALGIYTVVVHTISLIWGNDPLVFETASRGMIRFPSLVISYTRCQLTVLAVGLLGLFFAWLQWTRLGLQFRALASNRIEMGLRGKNVHYLRFLAFAISGALASVASLLVAIDLSFDPQVGLPALLLAVVASIIGGKQTFIGPVLGGIALGVLRAEVSWFFSASWQEAVTLTCLVGCLLFRPSGLLGYRTRAEAEP